MSEKNTKENSEKMDALVFIDANIFLDFYRLSNSIQLSFLNLVSENKDIIIFTSQVLMEYKKNRRNEIFKTITNLLNNKSEKKNYPAIIKEENSKIIRELEDKIDTVHKEKILQFKKIYINPKENDAVFKALDELESIKSSYFLSESHNDNLSLFDKAKKRFLKGYPPRKNDDTSLGDGINWEWIVQCSIASKKDIILVSRDGDFGKRFEKKFYVNDWLQHEFIKRTGKKIVLTSELSEAFDLLKIRGVNKEMRSAEHAIDMVSALESSNKILQMSINKNQYDLKALHEAINNGHTTPRDIAQLDLFSTYEELDLG